MVGQLFNYVLVLLWIMFTCTCFLQTCLNNCHSSNISIFIAIIAVRKLILKDLSKYFLSCKSIQGKFGKSIYWFLLHNNWLILLCLLWKFHLKMNFILFDIAPWIQKHFSKSMYWVLSYSTFLIKMNTVGKKAKSKNSGSQDQNSYSVTIILLENNKL